MIQIHNLSNTAGDYPTREEAERLLKEAEALNPGPWGNHSRTAAHCAEAIAAKCPGMDREKAYILGLLHDIGRRFGVRHLGHVSDGYSYMMSLGYPAVARICLTHSFHDLSLDDYIGKRDVSDEELKLIEDALRQVRPDDYDRLIRSGICYSCGADVIDYLFVEQKIEAISEYVVSDLKGLSDEELKAINGGILYSDCTWDDCSDVNCKLCKGLSR